MLWRRQVENWFISSKAKTQTTDSCCSASFSCCSASFSCWCHHTWWPQLMPVVSSVRRKSLGFQHSHLSNTEVVTKYSSLIEPSGLAIWSATISLVGQFLTRTSWSVTFSCNQWYLVLIWRERCVTALVFFRYWAPYLSSISRISSSWRPKSLNIMFSPIHSCTPAHMAM